jgi:hypothetical protein
MHTTKDESKQGRLCFSITAANRVMLKHNLLARLHHDQSGSISIMSVFAMLGLTMLLGMVVNVGRQVDGKVRMQNAADAAAYSGGLVLARGMNSLAFTNQLLCEVFAMTAWMREAHERHCDPYVPDILAAWSKEGPVFQGFPMQPTPGGQAIQQKFSGLGAAISQKVPLEQALVTAFSNWAAAMAGNGQDGGALELMETVLQGHMITEYQRAVVAAIPDMAQNAATTLAGLNGRPDYGRGTLSATLWWQGPGGGQPAPISGSGWLNAIAADPNGGDPVAASTARTQRDPLAQRYLRRWNALVLPFFDFGAKMSQYAPLWRSFTCGQLVKLLDEYADSNLPFVIRNELQPGSGLAACENVMDASFTFLGVASWGQVPQLSPGLFRNALAGNSTAYAAVRVFVPTSRLVWTSSTTGGAPSPIPMGGAPGWSWPSAPNAPAAPGVTAFRPGRQSVPTTWNLLNQHWTCQLVPATHPNVPAALQAAAPGFGGVASGDLEQVNYH